MLCYTVLVPIPRYDSHGTGKMSMVESIVKNSIWFSSGLSNPSIYNRESSSDSSWNVNLCSTGNLSTSTTCNVSPSSGGDVFNGNHISPFVGGNPPGPTSTTSSSGSRGLARFARLLNSQTPKSHQAKGWNQYQQGQLFPSGSGTGTEVTFALGTPRLLRRRRSLENEDLTSCRPRAVSIDSLLRNQKLLCPPGADGKGLSPKRYSTCSAGPSIGHRADQRLNEGKVKIYHENIMTLLVKFLLLMRKYEDSANPLLMFCNLAHCTQYVYRRLAFSEYICALCIFFWFFLYSQSEALRHCLKKQSLRRSIGESYCL